MRDHSNAELNDLFKENKCQNNIIRTLMKIFTHIFSISLGQDY